MIGVVVQPGVEFGENNLFDYDRHKAKGLSNALPRRRIAGWQNAIDGKSSLSRYGRNKRGKLLRILSRVTAELVYLARSRLDGQNRILCISFVRSAAITAG